jgi:excinuclease UvrABC ATPase subunit
MEKDALSLESQSIVVGSTPEHILKHIDVIIPRNQFVVLAGVK